MRGLLLVLLALVSFGALAEEPRERFDFLGRVISISKVPPDPCDAQASPGYEILCIEFYELWDVRYAVIDTLSGRAPGREVTVRIATHYGFPTFARYRHAVVRTARYENRYVVDDGFAVFRTRAGGWATCGDSAAFLRDEGPSNRMHAIEFAEDLGSVGTFTERGVRSAFDALDGHYDTVDGRLRCREGIASNDMYDMLTGKQPRVASGPPSKGSSDWLPTEVMADDPRFIGRLVSIERVPWACEAQADPKQHVCAQEFAWEARFAVIQPFSKGLKAPEVTVRTLGHPWYASYRNALVSSVVREDGHIDARAVPVFRTRDGDWATCGDPLRPVDDAPPSPRMRPIDFAEDLGQVGQLSDQGVRDAFYDFEGHFDIVDGHVRCREGIASRDLLDMLQTLQADPAPKAAP